MCKAEEILEMAEIMCGNYADGICAVDGCICNHNCEFNLTANHLYNRGYQYQQQWIPVTERLPEEPGGKYYETVIIAKSNGKVTVGCYRNRDCEWWGDVVDGAYSDITSLVTHWMPLPEPPERCDAE